MCDNTCLSMYGMNGYLNFIVINDLPTSGLQVKVYVFIYCILNHMYINTFIKGLLNTIVSICRAAT